MSDSLSTAGHTLLYRSLLRVAGAVLGGAIAVGFGHYLQQHGHLPWIRYNQYLSEADSAYQRGDLNRAIAQYRRIVALDRGDFQASLRLGVASAAAGRADEALAAFDHALAINPSCGECRHRKGTIFLTEWWRGDAVGELTAAAELKPGDAAIWSDLGVARALAGDRSGARVALLRALTLEPNLPGTRENLMKLDRGQ